MTRQAEAGFTLIEVLVSLALFAVIAGAGLSVMEQILRTQTQTDGRLGRLANQQRLMHLVTRDLSAAVPGSVQGDASTISMVGQSETHPVTVTYILVEGQAIRQVAQGRGDTVSQALLTKVAELRWQYLDAAGTWQDTWPATQSTGTADLAGVAMVLALQPGSGDLRRIVAVPRAGPP